MAKPMIKSPLSVKVIYVYRINDEAHKGKLKIGETSFKDEIFDNDKQDYINLLTDNHKKLNEVADKRIKNQTSTAGIKIERIYTTLGLYVNKDGKYRTYRDTNIHEVLKRSGIKPYQFGTDSRQNEWFEVDLETVKKAIDVIKQGKDSLLPNEITTDKSPIVLRDEQLEAVKKAQKCFQKKERKKFLWNCKMRFGKTISALTLVKESKYIKTIIITHRPTVLKNWFDDYQKVFYEEDNTYKFVSKDHGEKIIPVNDPFIYFASIQDLRGSDEVGGNFDKNNEIFQIDWDLVIVDEAHEGTQTELGKKVTTELVKKNTKQLCLSGTPFNLLEEGDYKPDEIYTWDYIQEQKAKRDWENNHPDEPNPYEDLPTLNIWTYDLGEHFADFIDDSAYFNFSEFFRVNENGTFVYENEVNNFLNLLTEDSDTSNYPFSNAKFRDYFKHSFWVLPGVKEAKALEELLQKHSVFGEGSGYKVINVAGDGSDDIDPTKSYDAVLEAISKNEYTITLSCGRLTTGVTVPEWTAVFMLYGNFSTSCSSYMQTIFRVQSQGEIDGKVKTDCYVFDFAPDRTLKVVSDAVTKSHSKDIKNSESEKEKIIGDFLNFCPIISSKGSRVVEYDTEKLVQTLKKVYIERVVKNGFEDAKIYSDGYLRNIGEKEIEKLNYLKDIIGKTKSQSKIKAIPINEQGFTNETERKEFESLEGKENEGKNPLTLEEKKRLEELRKKKNEENAKKKKAIAILRGISIRIPLIMYGAEIKDSDDENFKLSVDNFTSLVDSDSWEEFMPSGVTKEVFNGIKDSYDKDVFLGASKRIRQMARSLDNEGVLNRIQNLSQIFSTFRNPDKETVLTPWRVVNMHLGNTIGGYVFYDSDYKGAIEDPRFIEVPQVTDEVFTKNSKILEINSKTGLYPLYMAYSIFKTRENELKDHTKESERELWKSVIKENIFVLCKSPMAKAITYRTLLGFEHGDDKANIKFEEDLINKVKEGSQIESLVDKLHKTNIWSAYKKCTEEDSVNFDCIVGNPPYQEMDGGAKASSKALYNYFFELGKKLNVRYLDLIMPSRWMTGGKGTNKFREEMLNDKHIMIFHNYINSFDVFNNVEIKGGICYFLRDCKYEGKCSIYTYSNDNKKPTVNKRYLRHNDYGVVIRDSRMIPILEKVLILKEPSFEKKVSPRKPYGLSGDTFTTGPEKYHLPPFSDTPIKDGYKILGRDSASKRVYKYVSKDYPFPRKDGIDKFKIFISESYGCGDIGEGPATPVLATPGEGCSETFLQVFVTDSKEEVTNVIKYIKTKFLRLLVGIMKISQHATKKVYRFVPLQNFTSESDIDWSKSITDIDKQLYKKYKLSEEDINFIESNVKPME